MRRLADHLGIQAPSLYKHFPDKGAIERAVYVDYLIALRDALKSARQADDGRHPIERVSPTPTGPTRWPTARSTSTSTSCRTRGPRPPTCSRDNRRQWYLAAGDPDLAIAAYAFMRGMVELELHDLYPIHSAPPAALEHGPRRADRAGREPGARPLTDEAGTQR